MAPLASVDLIPRAREVARAAFASGALQPIDTAVTRVEDGGVTFLVREARNLRRKDVEQARVLAALDPAAPERAGEAPADRLEPPAFDPFEPVAPALDLGPLPGGYRAVLNKFPVLDDHVLLVTEHFEPQSWPLDPRALAALRFGLEATDGLVFYNGGSRAGASQPHRHLQLVPRGLAPGEVHLPIEAVLRQRLEAEPKVAPELPFPHAIAATPVTGEALFERYRALLDATGLRAPSSATDRTFAGHHNLLVTRRWMLLVPRRAEHVDGISFNAIGFAGALFGRTAEDVARIRDHGPMTMLRTAAGRG